MGVGKRTTGKAALGVMSSSCIDPVLNSTACVFLDIVTRVAREGRGEGARVSECLKSNNTVTKRNMEGRRGDFV